MGLAAELIGLDATAQADLVHRRELTPVQLVEAALERIDTLDPVVGAVVTLMAEHALAHAAEVDVAAPLAGVPMVLKDLVAEVAGVRFTECSRWLRDNVSTKDSELVLRHRRAGLVHVAKAAAPEFGLNSSASSALFGNTRNPWSLDHVPGGSSGGSAAAVAARMVPIGHGNDLAGSLRDPAGHCGLFALVPTRARNPLGPSYGDVASGWAMEHGLTLSVRDSAALLDATHGPSLGDPYCAPAPDRPYADEVGRDPGRLRIAVSTSGRTGPWHPEVAAAVADAAALLAGLGHHVEEAWPDSVGDDEWSFAMMAVLGGAVSWIRRHWATKLGREAGDDELERRTRLLFELGETITASQYLQAVETLQATARRVAAWQTRFDLWLGPTSGEPARPLTDFDDARDPLSTLAPGPWAAMPANISNVLGAPACSIPFAWASQGTPLGIHLLAPYGREDLLLRVASQVESARPWIDSLPPWVAERMGAVTTSTPRDDAVVRPLTAAVTTGGPLA